MEEGFTRYEVEKECHSTVEKHHKCFRLLQPLLVILHWPSQLTSQESIFDDKKWWVTLES
jgi:hypothetical protein